MDGKEYCMRLEDRIVALLYEIEYLKKQIQPTDTGHIHTAIAVLRNRLDQLIEELVNEDNT
jgi:predicted neuraminidase